MTGIAKLNLATPRAGLFVAFAMCVYSLKEKLFEELSMQNPQKFFVERILPGLLVPLIIVVAGYIYDRATDGSIAKAIGAARAVDLTVKDPKTIKSVCTDKTKNPNKSLILGNDVKLRYCSLTENTTYKSTDFQGDLSCVVSKQNGSWKLEAKSTCVHGAGTATCTATCF